MKIVYKRFVLPIVVFLFIWFLARLPMWSSHLQIDVWVFWQRIEYWYSHSHSFAGMSGNEVLPATLMYLFIPVFLIPVGWLSYTTYLPAILILNLGILIATLMVVKQKKIYLAGLFFFGPILLFRFDAVVTLLLILAFGGFVKRKYIACGAALGLAVGMKVFPIILLPYLLMIMHREKKYREMADLLATMALAGLVPVGIYLYLGGTLEQVKMALQFHSDKLISIESIPGSLITAGSLIVNKVPPPLLPGNGIWSVPGPVELFNRIWIVPIIVMYWVIWKSRALTARFWWEVPIGMILVFLIFSKNLNPQYIWWFMVLLPFTKVSKLTLGIMLTVALLNQLVYPVFYTNLIDNFYRENRDYWVFGLLILRNLGIVWLAARQLRALLPLREETE